MNEPNFNRAFYLPRLPREYYQGDAVVHWTLPISHRRRGWLNERFHAAFRELMLHTAAREGLFCRPLIDHQPEHGADDEHVPPLPDFPGHRSEALLSGEAGVAS